MVSEIEKGSDGKIRKVQDRYRNHTENINRKTWRAVRQLVLIHSADELDIVDELGKIATSTDYEINYHLRMCDSQFQYCIPKICVR